MIAIIQRDITLAIRSGGAWLFGLFFFAVFIALCAIALGGSLKVIRPLAPAIIWLSLVFSTMLSFSSIFQDDFLDGNLAQFKISGQNIMSLCVAKAISFFLISIFPLLIATPISALILDMQTPVVIATLLSIGLAAPALSVYGVFSGALLAGRRGGGFLIVLITTPFLIPLLIFGIEAINGYKEAGLLTLEYRVLLGLSMISIAVGLPAASAALRANLE